MALFRFDIFCEKWATCYAPINHQPGRDGKGKRFFRHDSLDERVAFVKTLTTFNETDLIMSCITAYDGELARMSEKAEIPNYVAWRRHVLFWCRQAQATTSKAPMDTEEAAANAKSRAVEAALDFVAFITQAKDARLRPEFRIKELEGVDLEEMEIATLPVAFNGWWAAVVNFDHIEPRPLCLVDCKYNADLMHEIFPKLKFNTIHK